MVTKLTECIRFQQNYVTVMLINTADVVSGNLFDEAIMID